MRNLDQTARFETTSKEVTNISHGVPGANTDPSLNGRPLRDPILGTNNEH